MEREHFIQKMTHFFTRFGIPADLPDREAAEAEQEAWVNELWYAVESWSGSRIKGFNESIDSYVASHKGGRPTVRQLHDDALRRAGLLDGAKARKEAASRPPPPAPGIRGHKVRFIRGVLDELKRLRPSVKARGGAFTRTFIDRAMRELGEDPSDEFLACSAASRELFGTGGEITDEEWAKTGPLIRKRWAAHKDAEGIRE